MTDVRMRSDPDVNVIVKAGKHVIRKRRRKVVHEELQCTQLIQL
jgi:hypothetical protein